MALVARSWNGLSLLEKSQRAAGRSIAAIATEVALNTKRVTHVQEGTLVRSVHAAPPGAVHDDDEASSATGDLLALTPPEAERVPGGAIIEVGSWLDYACVEWIGRAHPGITQGLEMSRGGKTDAIVAQAYREEGLA